MRIARDSFACAELDGFLYVCGGWGKDRELSSVERYDPASDAWTSVADLPSPRVSCAAAAVDGHLLVIGGFDRESCLDSIVRYDPLIDAWEPLASLPTARYGAACVAMAVIPAGNGD